MGVGARVLLIMFLLSLSLLFLSTTLAACSEQTYFSQSCPSGAYRCNPIKEGYTYQCNPRQQETCSLSVPVPTLQDYDCSYYKTEKQKVCGDVSTTCTKFGYYTGTCTKIVPYSYYYPCTQYRLVTRCSYRTISVCTTRVRMCSRRICIGFGRYRYCGRISYPCGVYMSCYSRPVRVCWPALESYRTTCVGYGLRTESYSCQKYGLYTVPCTKYQCSYKDVQKLVPKTCTRLALENKCMSYGTRTVYDTCIGDKTGYQVTIRDCKSGITALPFKYNKGDVSETTSGQGTIPYIPPISGSNLVLAGLGAAGLAGLAAYRRGLDNIKGKISSIFKKTSNQETSGGILNFLGNWWNIRRMVVKKIVKLGYENDF